jgi:peptidoglycan/LPS O-acetylase OafA/YrhL
MDINILLAFFNGSAAATKNTTGFIFLWFIPAFCSMSIIKTIFDNSTILIKILILFIGIVINYIATFTFIKLHLYIPFAITQGFYYFTIGFITKFVVDRIPNIQYFGIVVFLLLSYLYCICSFRNSYYLLPITGFLLIFSVRNILEKVSLLQVIGKYSFPIYLVHVIVYNFWEFILPKTTLFGVIDFILTIFISVLLAYIMLNVEFFQKLILPKNWNDIKSLFVKQIN